LFKTESISATLLEEAAVNFAEGNPAGIRHAELMRLVSRKIIIPKRLYNRLL
jgi:hypothetical protein